MKNSERVIVALDLPKAEDALALAQKITPVFRFFKIGSKLFPTAAPDFVRAVLKHGHVFLDLKYYDIATVVADAVVQAANMGVSLITMHASGGTEMMKLCREKASGLLHRPRLLGVTVLT